MTGLEGYPDPTVRRRFLSRWGQPRVLRMFEALHDRLRLGFLGDPTSVTFDLDSTVLTVYGRQVGAKAGSNPHKRGRLSYLSEVCVEGNTHDCWAARLRPGNAHVLQDAQTMLEQATAKLPSEVRQIRVRADGAFCDGGLLSYLEGLPGGYAIVAPMRRLVHRLAGLRYQMHKGTVQTRETDYAAHGWKRARRFIVIRRPAPEEPSWQGTLFQLEGFVHRALVTNLDLEPLNVWRFYNDRAHIEQVIREWRHGWSVGQLPRRDAAANTAWFHLVLFAFNLLNWFKRRCVAAELRKATTPTSRQRLRNVPAALVRPQGKPMLRLPAGYPYMREFESALGRARHYRVPRFGVPPPEPWFTQDFGCQ